ncbi:MAG: hypothetical protein COB50_01455 [Thiotrichales bacterium]|nr:MAG: hypothetical protein COB50_01455 [Thiotrichales bacterium]
MIHTTYLKILETISKVINKAISLDTESGNLLGELCNKVLSIQIKELNCLIHCIQHDNKISILDTEQYATWKQAQTSDVAEIQLSARALDFLKLARSKQPQAVLAEGNVEIIGDFQVLLTWQKFYQTLNLDIDNLIYEYLPDSAAYYVSSGLKKFIEWQKHVMSSNVQNFADYVKEEKRLFPRSNIVQSFYEEVNTTYLAVERMDAKLVKIQQLLKDNPIKV